MKKHIQECRLTFIKVTRRDFKSHKQIALYKCKCGTIKEYLIDSIKRGNTKSCGCLRKEFPNRKVHGIANHPIYATYINMMKRCYNPTDKSYQHYGAKGVKVCKKWRNNIIIFYNWCIDNGWQPSLQLDKDIKGNGLLYSPQTCSLVSGLVNSQYKTNTIIYDFEGERHTINSISRKTGIPSKTIEYRIIHLKMSIEKAVYTPSRNSLSKWKPYVGKM